MIRAPKVDEINAIFCPLYSPLSCVFYFKWVSFWGKKKAIYDHLFNKVFTFKYPFYPKIGGIHGILVRASYVCMYVSMIQNRIRLM